MVLKTKILIVPKELPLNNIKVTLYIWISIFKNIVTNLSFIFVTMARIYVYIIVRLLDKHADRVYVKAMELRRNILN